MRWGSSPGSRCARRILTITAGSACPRWRLQAGGGALIVADPRQTPTARRATLHLQLTPGTDLALANGLLHIAIAEGRLDESYIAARTSGFGEVRRIAAAYWPERVERITGVTVAE